MAESLPELIARRQGELGARSVLELYRRLPDGDDRITYETFRKLAIAEQRGSRDPRVPRDVALILDASESAVRAALDMEPNLGQWSLPARAQGLDQQERAVVEQVVDALLRAKRRGGSSASTDEPRKKIPTLAEARRARRQQMIADAQQVDSAATHDDGRMSDE